MSDNEKTFMQWEKAHEETHTLMNERFKMMEKFKACAELANQTHDLNHKQLERKLELIEQYQKTDNEAIRKYEGQIAELNTWREGVNKGLGVHLDAYCKLEEGLRDHINAHKYLADQGSEIKIMDKWIEHLNTALEKLDSSQEKSDKEKFPEIYEALSKLAGKAEKKEVCKHKNTSSSSDPLIWYICHDCGAHLNQRFEEIPKGYHEIVNEVLNGFGGENTVKGKSVERLKPSSSLREADSNPLELNLSGLKCPICLEKYRKDEIEFECPYCKCEMYVEELSKPKEKPEPEKAFEFQLVEKFIPPRGVHCENCMNNPVPKLIEEFLEKLKNINWDAICNWGVPVSIQQIIKEYEGRVK